jgi:hypothetical protein
LDIAALGEPAQNLGSKDLVLESANLQTLPTVHWSSTAKKKKKKKRERARGWGKETSCGDQICLNKLVALPSDYFEASKKTLLCLIFLKKGDPNIFSMF